ncbi:6-phospho-beta-glucosidase [Klebsiella pneumoniae]|uniref:6-phospho-beta-glucosidase n=1 Tax=Klebsiella pneumoniae TaxID=573 RepID=A0A377ZN52_KLEPN|nr:6-phospho-beta-glucosidase [Klebsiella pneumoniae]
MQALKIAVIGGGSSYTPELIEGIIVRYEQLPVTELALVDVESGREKVEIIAALTRRMLKHKGLEQVAVSVHFTLDEAIRGASFVLTQLRVGQLAGARPPMSGWVSSTTCWARRPPASAVLPRRCGRSR